VATAQAAHRQAHAGDCPGTALHPGLVTLSNVGVHAFACLVHKVLAQTTTGLMLVRQPGKHCKHAPVGLMHPAGCVHKKASKGVLQRVF